MDAENRHLNDYSLANALDDGLNVGLRPRRQRLWRVRSIQFRTFEVSRTRACSRKLSLLFRGLE